MSQKIGMGWLPDPPDFRDYTDQTEEVRCILQKRGCLTNRPTSPMRHAMAVGVCGPW